MRKFLARRKPWCISVRYDASPFSGDCSTRTNKLWGNLVVQTSGVTNYVGGCTNQVQIQQHTPHDLIVLFVPLTTLPTQYASSMYFITCTTLLLWYTLLFDCLDNTVPCDGLNGTNYEEINALDWGRVELKHWYHCLVRPTVCVLEKFYGTSEGRCDRDWSVHATLWLVMAVLQISCYSVWLMWDTCVSPHTYRLEI